MVFSIHHFITKQVKPRFRACKFSMFEYIVLASWGENLRSAWWIFMFVYFTISISLAYELRKLYGAKLTSAPAWDRYSRIRTKFPRRSLQLTRNHYYPKTKTVPTVIYQRVSHLSGQIFLEITSIVWL